MAVLGSLHAEARHLALDHAGVGPAASLGEQLEEQLSGGPALGVVEDLRGKNPGATPSSGVPPGGSA